MEARKRKMKYISGGSGMELMRQVNNTLLSETRTVTWL